MQKDFENIDPYHLSESIFKLIGKDWMLIASGGKNNFNMMTASWGTCGILWNKPIAVIFVRPQRYTYDFLEKNDHFSLNFFDMSYRETLNLLGTQSGRDIDKMAIEELHADELESGTVYFQQARMVMECKKIYYDDIKPEFFTDPSIHNMYPAKDYHRMYIGELKSCWERKQVQ